MRFLCDVHISYQLVKCLQKLGFECKHVNELPNKWNTSDVEISKYCDTNDFILITKDQDFKNTHFVNQTPKRLIRITLGNISNLTLIEIFGNNIHHIIEAMKTSNCYIEINDSHIEKNID